MTRIAVYQAQTGIDPAANLAALEAAISEAAAGGAQMLFTPEMSGLLDRNRERARAQIARQEDDALLKGVCAAAQQHGIWVMLGSLALKAEGGKEGGAEWVNRSLAINDQGDVVATYDKLHMFDVNLASGESWKESNAYRPGERVTCVDTPAGRVGLAICYDLRFPALFARLGEKGCDVLSIPAAFTRPTGADHWHVMQRARAIEASAYVVAAAQVGAHEDGRETYGHSLVVDPWGKVLLDMDGEKPGVGFAEIDPARIADVRAQVPSLANRRAIPNW